MDSNVQYGAGVLGVCRSFVASTGRRKSSERPVIREEGFLTAEEMTRLHLRMVPLLSRGMSNVGLLRSWACSVMEGEAGFCSTVSLFIAGASVLKYWWLMLVSGRVLGALERPRVDSEKEARRGGYHARRVVRMVCCIGIACFFD